MSREEAASMIWDFVYALDHREQMKNDEAEFDRQFERLMDLLCREPKP